MTLRIERTDAPTDEERQAILAPLRAYNTAQTGGSAPELVAWLVREQARGQGTGSELMQMAEQLAREKDCVGIWLDTFDFQAPDFYRRHGFTECGQINDYPPGHQRFFFQKRLIQTV
jgi:GNAT superfamily N-acetyltransferase